MTEDDARAARIARRRIFDQSGLFRPIGLHARIGRHRLRVDGVGVALPRRHRRHTHTHNSQTTNAGGVDPFKEIGSTLEVVEETQLLTKLAKTGLLSKAERAGVKLADLEPLLLFAEENGLVGLLGDLNDELLPLLPLLVRLAPLGLPVVSLALGLGPLNFLLAIASFGGAFVVTGLPDDSVTDVALQTLIAVPLATLFPVLFGGLGLVSSKLA